MYTILLNYTNNCISNIISTVDTTFCEFCIIGLKMTTIRSKHVATIRYVIHTSLYSTVFVS